MSKRKIYEITVSKAEFRYTPFLVEEISQLKALQYVSDYLKNTSNEEHKFVTKHFKSIGLEFDDLDIKIIVK
jgi:hypothetical protein